MEQKPSDSPSPARTARLGVAEPSPRPLPTRERQRRETRDLIFQAAMHEISTAGLARARIEQIARRAGVTRPTFYAHFPTKEDVLLELQSRTERSTLEALRQRLGQGDPDAHRRSLGDGLQGRLVHDLVDAVFDLMQGADPVLRREAFGLMVRESGQARWPDNELFEFVRDRLGEAQQRGEIEGAVDAGELTRIVMTALFGFLAIDAEPFDERRASAHELIRLLIAGASSS